MRIMPIIDDLSASSVMDKISNLEDPKKVEIQGHQSVVVKDRRHLSAFVSHGKGRIN